MKNNKNIKLTEFEIFESIIGNFVRQEIPDNWSDLNYKEQEKYVKENLIKAFRSCDALEIINLMEIASSALVHLLEEKGIEVSD